MFKAYKSWYNHLPVRKQAGVYLLMHRGILFVFYILRNTLIPGGESHSLTYYFLHSAWSGFLISGFFNIDKFMTLFRKNRSKKQNAVNNTIFEKQ